MFFEIEPGGGGRRPAWRVFYLDDEITVTSWYVLVDGLRIPVSVLRDVEIRQTHRYPVVKIAAVMSGIEAAIAVASAAAYGSAWTILAGLFSVGTVTTGAIVDYWKNPRYQAIEATINGRRVVLFSTRDKRKCGQVQRALIRALEDNRSPRP